MGGLRRMLAALGLAGRSFAERPFAKGLLGERLARVRVLPAGRLDSARLDTCLLTGLLAGLVQILRRGAHHGVGRARRGLGPAAAAAAAAGLVAALLALATLRALAALTALLAFGALLVLALGPRLLLEERHPVGDRNLVVVGVDLAEGEEAVAVAPVLDEGGLQRRLDPRDLGEIDVAAQLAAASGLEVEFLDLGTLDRHHPGLFRVGGIDEHLVGHDELSAWRPTAAPLDGGIRERTLRRVTSGILAVRGRTSLRSPVPPRARKPAPGGLSRAVPFRARRMMSCGGCRQSPLRASTRARG